MMYVAHGPRIKETHAALVRKAGSVGSDNLQPDDNGTG